MGIVFLLCHVCTESRRIKLQPIKIHCEKLQGIHFLFWTLYSYYAIYALQTTATQCNPLKHTATTCDTLQHTAAQCTILHYTATNCNILQLFCGCVRGEKTFHIGSDFSRATRGKYNLLQCVAVCCSVLKGVTVFCSALQCAAVCRSVWRILQCIAVCCAGCVLLCRVLHATCRGSVLRCVAARCSVLQCIVACCNMLQSIVTSHSRTRHCSVKKTLETLQHIHTHTF